MEYPIHPNHRLEVEHQFTHHPPHGDQVQRYQEIREAGKAFALVILRCAPPCADRSAAIRDVRRAVMETNAAIAINEPIAPAFQQPTKDENIKAWVGHEGQPASIGESAQLCGCDPGINYFCHRHREKQV